MAQSWSWRTSATAIWWRSLLEAEKPEVVFHLAAQIDVRVSAAKPSFDAEVNVLGTINMLEAARRCGARRFVYASTGGAIYGETDIVPTPEGTEIRSEAPYGQAKYAGEGYLSLWNRLHGLSTVSLRFGNVYGPRQDPLGEAGVIAIFCGKLQTAASRRCSATAARRATTCLSTTSCAPA